MTEPHLAVEGLRKEYPVRRGWTAGPQSTLVAVDDVSLTMAPGETLGLVGESGCGKSTMARLIMRLDRPTAGRILLGGQDIAKLPRRRLVEHRRRFQMIFQDPYASLNPRMTARRIIAEPLLNYRIGSRDDVHRKVLAVAEQTGLSDYHLDRYPHELSGGQCQRIGIARAIAIAPELIVADEPVSALDVSIQAQVINLILRLQRDLALTLLFISHDLSVVAHVADRVAVMYLGRIVEIAPSTALFSNARHPYTQALIRALPRPRRPDPNRTPAVTGELPSPIDRPTGCHFRTRCPFATAICAQETPPRIVLGDGHALTCHHATAIPALHPDGSR